jgi:hypothetical protein
MKPAQQALQIQAINCIFEGYGGVVTISLPKTIVKGRGKTAGAKNKNTVTATTTSKPTVETTS